MGAWIEIKTNYVSLRSIWSLPSWERGLKSLELLPSGGLFVSLPSWERGLKYKLVGRNKIRCSRSPRGSVD